MRTAFGRPYAKKRGRTGGRIAKFGATSLVVMMLAMALLPLMSTGVSAANNEINVVNSRVSDVVIDDLAVEPEESPEPDFDPDIVSEEFDDELIDDIVVDPQPTGTIQIVKYGCADDFGGDYGAMVANCPAMSADFGVYYNGGEQYFNGSFIAENVAAGQVGVVETIPAGYGQPYVFCSSTDAADSQSLIEQVSVEQGAVGFELEAGEYIYCDWMNVEQDFNGTVTIKKWECPENLAFIAAPTWNDYSQACSTWMNDVEFNLDYADDMQTDLSGKTGDDGDGTLIFDDVAAGNLSIIEQIPSGYGDPVIYCGWGAIYDEDGDGVAVAIDGVAGGGLIAGGKLDLEFYPAETLYCDIFNMPYENDDNVVIYKWECPEGFDAYNASYDELLSNCDQAMENVEFSLYGDGENFIGAESTDGSGYVGFEDVDAGSYGLNESLPSGYGKPIVYCDRPDYGFENWPVYGDASIQFDLYDGGWISCNWFNVPDDSDIVIYKWECPEGFNAYDANYDELIESCDQVMSGIEYNVYGGNELLDTVTTDESGTVSLGSLESGDYAIQEVVPSGYGKPVVYCTIEGYDSENYPVDDYGQIQFGYENGSIVCNWFNIPTYDGSITIIKFTCEPGYDFEAWGADPKSDCWNQTDDIRFDLYGDGYSEYGYTGDNGYGAVAFSGLDSGDYTIEEAVPAETVATYVICQWTDSEGPFKYDTFNPYSNGGSTVGNAIDLELYEGSNIVCWWYNAPDYQDGGELVVIKYWCDGAIYDEMRCDLYGGGADFEIEPAGGWGSPYQFTTGWDGTATLYLESGAYSLSEIDRAWCKAKSDQVDSDGNVVISEGQTSYVTVFNCGPGKEKEPPAKKFPNTGVATMTTEVGSNGGSSMGLIFSMGMVVAVFGLRAAQVRTAKAATRIGNGR